MRYTVLLLPGEEPGIYVAFVPALDVVTQGRGIERALVAAEEASALAVSGMIEDGEEVPIERGCAVTAAIEVPVPTGAVEPAA